MAFSSPKWHREFYSFFFLSEGFWSSICHLSEERTWVDVTAEELLSPFQCWRRGSAGYRQVMAKGCRGRRCLVSSSTAQSRYWQYPYLTHDCPSVLPVYQSQCRNVTATSLHSSRELYPFLCTEAGAQVSAWPGQSELLGAAYDLEWQGTCMMITSGMAFLLLVWHGQYGQAQKRSLILLCGLVRTLTQYQSWLPHSDKFGISGYFRAQYSLSLPNYMN